MIIRTCAFTTAGWELINRIENALPDHVLERITDNSDLDNWVKESFELKAPILFVGAMGIAVRKIAHYVDSKLTDSPVVVIDELGRFVIPILSNHIGGANEIAAMLATVTQGQLVITTATDVQGAFAVDIFAKKNGLEIVNKEGIKEISAKILNGSKISMAVNFEIEIDKNDIPDCIELVKTDTQNIDIFIDVYGDNGDVQKKATLMLIFKPYIIGVGCKKDTEYSKLEHFIAETLADKCIDEKLIAGMASIDIKKREKGLLYYEAKHRIPFSTYSSDELQAIEGIFAESEFVKDITGVANVCERAATRLAGEGAEMIMPKLAKDGMTLAVCKRKVRISKWKM